MWIWFVWAAYSVHRTNYYRWSKTIHERQVLLFLALQKKRTQLNERGNLWLRLHVGSTLLKQRNFSQIHSLDRCQQLLLSHLYFEQHIWWQWNYARLLSLFSIWALTPWRENYARITSLLLFRGTNSNYVGHWKFRQQTEMFFLFWAIIDHIKTFLSHQYLSISTFSY